MPDIGVALKQGDWGPNEAAGKPNTQAVGDFPTAWASLTKDDQVEWLLLAYDQAVFPTAIEIHESHNPGAVNTVTVYDSQGKEITGQSNTGLGTEESLDDTCKNQLRDESSKALHRLAPCPWLE